MPRGGSCGSLDKSSGSERRHSARGYVAAVSCGSAQLQVLCSQMEAMPLPSAGQFRARVGPLESD